MVKFMKEIKYKVKELEIHSDERGWLVEMLKRNELKKEIKQINVATIKPGGIRGNHYHLKRTEWFLIIRGKAEFYLADLKTEEKVCFKISPNKATVITVFPKIAHAVKNSGKGIAYLVEAQNTIYNPKNPDTFPHLICK